MKHQDKVVLITGAAQGLGLACAERFHAEGANVFLVDVKADEVRRPGGDLRADGGRDGGGRTAALRGRRRPCQ